MEELSLGQDVLYDAIENTMPILKDKEFHELDNTALLGVIAYALTSINETLIEIKFAIEKGKE
jgi:hypothetical protein